MDETENLTRSLRAKRGNLYFCYRKNFLLYKKYKRIAAAAATEDCHASLAMTPQLCSYFTFLFII